MEETKGEIYVFGLRFSGFSKDNVLRAARTLSKKPVILNGRMLQYPNNSVFFAEYDEKTDEIKVILIAAEREMRAIYNENRQLFASASVSEKWLPLLAFTDLILSTEPLESGCKISLNRVPDRKTAIRLIFS